MIVYIDIIFLINLMMNLCILYLVSLALNLKITFFRLFLSSLLGCLFLLELFSYRLELLKSFHIKMLISIAMAFISFWPFNLKGFIRILGFFYLISFLVGGSALAFFYFFNIDIDPLKKNLLTKHISLQWWILLLSSIVILILFKYLWPKIYKALQREQLLLTICINFGEKSIKTKALVDTGNDLCDPISRYPVIITEDKVLRKLLNDSQTEYFLTDKAISCSQLANRIRVIPYESIGKSKGIMMGFRPDSITVELKDKNITTDKAVLGIYKRTLSDDGSYNALLNPDILSQ